MSASLEFFVPPLQALAQPLFHTGELRIVNPVLVLARVGLQIEQFVRPAAAVAPDELVTPVANRIHVMAFVSRCVTIWNRSARKLCNIRRNWSLVAPAGTLALTSNRV